MRGLGKIFFSKKRSSESNGYLLREAIGFFLKYACSEERKIAWALLSGIILFNLIFSGLLIFLNEWSGRFYNALQELDLAAFIHQLYQFFWLVALIIIFFLSKYFMTSYLAIRWERWMTKRYVKEWLTEKRYYNLSFLTEEGIDNPDQRLSEDIPNFVTISLSLGEGILSALFTLVFFSVLLWNLSSSIEFFGLKIPGFLFWVACLYAGGGTWLTLKIGKPLVGLNFQKELLHGTFRYALVRVREYAEAIASFKGELHEEKELMTRYGNIVHNAFLCLRQNMKMNLWSNFYFNAQTIMPALVMAPSFFAKRFKLGIFMQVSSAFTQVHTSLSFIVQSYMVIAQWQAVTKRLVDLDRLFLSGATLLPRDFKGINHQQISTETLQATFTEICLPHGRCLLKDVSLILAPGDSVLIQGPSGVGKSTLLKALCGLWVFGEGDVRHPPGSVLLLTQRPYLPSGTLKAVLAYPSQASFSEEAFIESLEAVGLAMLIPVLDERRDWHHILSLGEQQRLNFARLFLQQPNWIFMDESTSSLDEASEEALLARLKDRLPFSSIISVGHRSTLKPFHSRVMLLESSKTH